MAVARVCAATPAPGQSLNKTLVTSPLLSSTGHCHFVSELVRPARSRPMLSFSHYRYNLYRLMVLDYSVRLLDETFSFTGASSGPRRVDSGTRVR